MCTQQYYCICYKLPTAIFHVLSFSTNSALFLSLYASPCQKIYYAFSFTSSLFPTCLSCSLVLTTFRGEMNVFCLSLSLLFFFFPTREGKKILEKYDTHSIQTEVIWIPSQPAIFSKSRNQDKNKKSRLQTFFLMLNF